MPSASNDFGTCGQGVALARRLSMTIRTTSPSHSTDQRRPAARRSASPRSLHSAIGSSATAAADPPGVPPLPRPPPHPTVRPSRSLPDAAPAAPPPPGPFAQRNARSCARPPAWKQSAAGQHRPGRVRADHPDRLTRCPDRQRAEGSAPRRKRALPGGTRTVRAWGFAGLSHVMGRAWSGSGFMGRSRGCWAADTVRANWAVASSWDRSAGQAWTSARAQRAQRSTA